MTDPTPEERLRTQIETYHAAGLAYAAVKLALPETMGTERWTVERLADALNLPAPHLDRLLRGLVILDLVEVREGGYALTAAGQSLIPGAASALREKLLIVVEQYWRPWANVAASVTGGVPAFDEVFGAKVQDWRRANPAHGKAFDAYVARETFTVAGPVLELLDLSGAKTVADLSGGHGGLLAALLTRHPRLRGVLLTSSMSVPAAEAYLAEMGVADRTNVIGGDILAGLPAAADISLLPSVLQQHSDDGARRILETCRDSLKPSGRLVVIERPMPDNAHDDPAAVMLDLHMMTITGGRVRTKGEMEALIADADLRILTAARTSGGLAVIETAAS